VKAAAVTEADAAARRRLAVALAVAAGLGLLLLYRAGGPGPEFHAFRGEAMSTRWELVLPDRPDAAAAAQEVFANFRRLEAELSEWQPDSPLTAVNRAAGTAPVAVPDDLRILVERSLEIGRATEGAFDVTWAALWKLWDFRASAPRVPTPERVAVALRLVDHRRVVVDRGGGTVFLPEHGMLLGLGGIAKGYALERAAALLEARGLHDFLLVGGGQVLARGRRGGRPWQVGVRDPRGAPDDLFARVELGDASLSTSADNESYFVVGGVRYHHILDPRTGMPARGLRSATVLHADATLADALSTAVLVLGRDAGLAIAQRLGAEAIVVDDAGAVAATPGLARRYELVHPPWPE
jgi:thiamine biosynthesis lipoprotein